ncbi:MAG: hypothetical protein ACOYLH_12260 [Flavobacteriales bacterium]|jgi:hypothetical protein
MVYARNVKYIERQKDILSDFSLAQKIRQEIIDGDIYVAKNVFDNDLILKMREYLTNVGSHSLPNYNPIELGCPNFHRLNIWDERAHVKGCFHQFVFFPWNQDVFNLFDLANETYQVKNVLSNNSKDKFLGRHGNDGCVSRIAFQFYPAGSGGLNKHSDPVDHHQLCVPTLTMSKKKIDFIKGGAYVETNSGHRVYTDEISEPGDIVYFNALIPHGVEIIDPEVKSDWLSFKGRWMLLFAVNKLTNNNEIADAVDLESY